MNFLVGLIINKDYNSKISNFSLFFSLKKPDVLEKILFMHYVFKIYK